jgi:hypothetical protein
MGYQCFENDSIVLCAENATYEGLCYQYRNEDFCFMYNQTRFDKMLPQQYCASIPYYPNFATSYNETIVGEVESEYTSKIRAVHRVIKRGDGETEEWRHMLFGTDPISETPIQGKRRLIGEEFSPAHRFCHTSGLLAFSLVYSALLRGKYDIPEPTDVLIGGMGAGSLAQFFIDFLPNTAIDLVDIDPQVFVLCERYFGFDPTKARNVVAQDMKQFLRETNRTYDKIFVDVFNARGIPPGFFDEELTVLLEKRMKPWGVLIVNTFDNGSPERDYVWSLFRNHFKSVELLPASLEDEFNVGIVAYNSEMIEMADVLEVADEFAEENNDLDMGFDAYKHVERGFEMSEPF